MSNVKTPKKSSFKEVENKSSPRTPLKKGRRTSRSSEKDTTCLCCGIYLVGVVKCTYNLETYEGLQEKLEHLIDSSVDLSIESCRVCKTCFRRIEALSKKFFVFKTEVEDLRWKFFSSRKCAKTSEPVKTPEVVFKRCAKSSPVNSKKRVKGRLFELSHNDQAISKNKTDVFCEMDFCDVSPLQQELSYKSENSLRVQEYDCGAENKVPHEQDLLPSSSKKPVCSLAESKEDNEKNQEDKHKDKGLVEVYVKFPSSQRVLNLCGEIAQVVMNLALGTYRTACKTSLKNSILAPILQDLVIEKMDKECQNLCRKTTASLVRKTGADNLTEFKLDSFKKELQTRAPLTAQTLLSLCQSRRSKTHVDENVVTTVGAIILHARCSEMSALAYRLGFIMHHAGAGTMGLEILQKHGITVSQKSLSLKAGELGRKNDKEVIQWKEECVLRKEKEKCSSLLKENLELLSYLPQLPSLHDVQKYLEVMGRYTPDAGDSPCMENQSGLTTINVKDLNLCCDQQEPESLLESVITQICEKGIDKEVLYKCLEEVSNTSSGSNNLMEALETYDSANNSGLDYQIVGDNVDLDIKVRHMNEENRNKSLHYFNIVAFKDQVSGESLPDVLDHTLADIPVTRFLPSHDDLKNLKRDFVVLWSRVIVKYMTHFSFLKRSVIYHIPHPYSEVMKNPVEEVPLGVLPKNESKNEDMVDILETIQDRYVPFHVPTQCGKSDKVPSDMLFFGKWIKRHRNRWHRQNRHLYKHV